MFESKNTRRPANRIPIPQMALKQKEFLVLLIGKKLILRFRYFLELNKFLGFPGGLAVNYLAVMHEMLETRV